MKSYYIKTISMCLGLSALCAQASSVSPYISIRSQSVDAVRELVGWQNHINLCRDSFYSSFTVTPEYTHTFHPTRIADSLFGDDIVGEPSCGDICCPAKINVTGSNVPDRDATKDWMADYFGLPRDFSSTLNFCPVIQNVNVDLNLYLGFGKRAEGLFFRIHAPVTWTRWDLHVTESIHNSGSNGGLNDIAALDLPGGYYPFGYFSDSETAIANLNTSAQSFFAGNAPLLSQLPDPDAPFPDAQTGIGAVTFQPLKYAKFNLCNTNCMQTVRLSDIEMELGYNFRCTDDYHCGIALRASAPTGNKPRAEYAFEPIAGSGGFAKLGLNLTMHRLFWHNDADTSSIGFWFEGNVQHLFAAHQWRTFDLKDKPNSRYMLAQRIGDLELPESQTLTAPDAGVHFENQFAPVANLTTRQVDVTVAVEGDLVFKFAYTHDSGYQFDLGYELWARSCEEFCDNGRCLSGLIDDTSWALKGDAFVVGYRLTLSALTAVPLAATESTATIHGGTNATTDPNGATISPENITIDNGLPATTSGGTVISLYGQDQVNSSNPPIYITTNDIDYCGAATRGLSNKIFANISYTCDSIDNWTPFWAIGASAEFVDNNNCDECVTAENPCGTNSCCDSCNNTAVNQWALWAKWGVSFE